MDFAAIIAFLVLYYVRPQEWIDGLGSMRPVLFVFIGGIIAMIFRDRGFSPKDLIKTPHDWIMTIYFLWIALATASNEGNWGNIGQLLVGTVLVLWSLKNLMGFYYVVVQALHTRERIEKFLWWWLGMILLLSIIGVASKAGFDIMGSEEIWSNERFQGRLVLNNGLYNNPNELGHTIVPLIPLIYLLCVWRRSPAVKTFTLLLLYFPLAAVYMTRSKGSYISGAITSMVAVMAGRPKFVQITVAFVALTIGAAALQALPRMGKLRSPRDDEGIQGRLSVFAYGYQCFRRNKLLGKDNFATKYGRDSEYEPKASHSSYNQIGAELGMPGLFLYLAAFYCCLRTLLRAKTFNDTDERIRRVLLCALVAFMVSSWVIDFAYHGTFFFLIACCAAFHRHLLHTYPEDVEADDVEAEETKEDEDIAEGEPSVEGEPLYAWEKDDEKSAEDQKPAAAISWNRFGLVDFVFCTLMLLAAYRFWHYVIYSWGQPS